MMCHRSNTPLGETTVLVLNKVRQYGPLLGDDTATRVVFDDGSVECIDTPFNNFDIIMSQVQA